MLAVFVGLVSAGQALAAGQYFNPVGFNAGLGNVIGVAVDTSASVSSGDVYATAGTTVNKYTAANAAAGSSAPDGQLTGFGYVWGVAVDPSNGDVYVTDTTTPGVLHKYDATGAPVSFTVAKTVATQLIEPSAIAVSPTNGHVFVGTLSGSTIYELDSSGADTTNTYVGPGGTLGLAVNAAGDLYAAAGGAGAIEFTEPGISYTSISLVSAEGVAVSASDQHVLVSGGGALTEFDAAGSQVESYSGLASAYGVAVDGDATHAYVGDNGAGSDIVLHHGILASSTTGATVNLQARSVTLTGHVDPNGGPDASCSFSYSINPELTGATTVPCAPVGPYSAATDVTADVSGLAPASTYYYRLTVTNGNADTAGEVNSFETPNDLPGATTSSASDLSDSGATLNGTVSPNGAQTTYHFEYGLTSSYGSRVPAEVDLAAGNGRRHGGVSQSLRVSQNLTGLEAGKTYHYRLLATSALGSVQGADSTFVTDAAAQPARVYEMVSPVENGDVPVSPYSQAIKASPDGSAIMYATEGASYPGSVAGAHTPRVLATRTETGWQTVSLEPPSLNTVNGAYLFSGVLDVSDDMKHAFVASTHKLAEGAVEGHVNTYVYDTQAKNYTFVADVGGDTSLVGEEGYYRYYGASSDMSTVAFKSGNLYVWSAKAGLRIASSSPDDGYSASREPHIVSSDGSRVVFRDAGTGFLYSWSDGVATLISTDTPGFLGASPDGRYVMYQTGSLGLYRWDANTDKSELLAESVNQHPLDVRAATGDAYYYLGGPSTAYYEHAGHSEFVGSNVAATGKASPSGRYFAFETADNLTSYDSGGHTEVYLFDANTGETICASCRADGGPATGSASTGVAGVPEFAHYFTRAVTDAGEVYFDTPDPLVSSDVNGLRDVYSYLDGHVSLISPGTAGFEARFHESTPDGRNVYFTTDQQLVPQDQNNVRDLYDARVGGGFEVQAQQAVLCTGPDCHGEGSTPPSLPVAGSILFTGPGNLAGSALSNRSRVSVSKPKVIAGMNGALKVTVPSKGQLILSGDGLRSVRRNLGKAGTVTVALALSPTARARLRAKHRLRTSVRVLFRPSGGGSSTAVVVVKFKASARKGR